MLILLNFSDKMKKPAVKPRSVKTPGSYSLSDPEAAMESFNNDRLDETENSHVDETENSHADETEETLQCDIDEDSQNFDTEDSQREDTEDSQREDTEDSQREDTEDSQEEDLPNRKKRPSRYKTKKVVREEKNEKIVRVNQKLLEAKLVYEKGGISMYKIAKQLDIPYSTLQEYIQFGQSLAGKGRKSTVMCEDEEQKVIEFVTQRAELGCGVGWDQLRSIIQELLIRLCAANPNRSSSFEECGHLPNKSFVRRFADRHNLALLRTMELSKGRQILTTADLSIWQEHTKERLLGNPILAECFKDPRRIFNQDETSVVLGSSQQRVLAPKGTNVLYSISSGSRDHITVSFCVSAAGGMVPPRVVLRGKRNLAEKNLEGLGSEGLSGKWCFSVAPKGYVVRETMLEIIMDMVHFILKYNIPTPVILVLDGASPHISIEAAELCQEYNIQPWLLKPNMSHILQPLDLSLFSSLKKAIAKLVYGWQSDPGNAGQYLNKYTIVHLLREATEQCLQNKTLVGLGFKRAGLYPWDPTQPDRRKLKPSSIYASNSSEPNQIVHPVTEDGEDSRRSQGGEERNAVGSPGIDAEKIDPIAGVAQSSRQDEFGKSADRDVLGRMKSHQAVLVREDENDQQVAIMRFDREDVMMHEKEKYVSDSANPNILKGQVSQEPNHSQSSSCPDIPATISNIQDTNAVFLSTQLILREEDSFPSLTFPEYPDQGAQLSPPSEEQISKSPQIFTDSDLTVDTEVHMGANESDKDTSDVNKNKKPFWFGKTKRCCFCDRFVLSSVLAIHERSCSNSSSLTDEDSVPDSNALNLTKFAAGVSKDDHQIVNRENVPQQSQALNLDGKGENSELFDLSDLELTPLSLSEWLDELKKFEVIFLSKSQVAKFEEAFKRKKFGYNHTKFQCWLRLKFSSVGTESQAIDHFLSSKLATNVPKRRVKRIQNVPNGSARYDITSEEWKKILNEKKNKDLEKNNKTKAKAVAQKVPVPKQRVVPGKEKSARRKKKN